MYIYTGTNSVVDITKQVFTKKIDGLYTLISFANSPFFDISNLSFHFKHLYSAQYQIKADPKHSNIY